MRGEVVGNFEHICQAIKYIDDHLDERIGLEQLAKVFHFSPYYFHRMFTLIVGKPIASHTRDRRMERAGRLLASTAEPLIDISMNCGFESYPAFSRAFAGKYGVSPREFRKIGCPPVTVSADQMIANLEKRLRGGVLVNPKLIDRGAMLIAGVSGDGSKTRELWENFMRLNEQIGLPDKLSDNGYEVRVWDGDKSWVHVGLLVSSEPVDDAGARESSGSSTPQEGVDEAFTVFRLPASKYALFEVFVAKGYESGNAAMDEWLLANAEVYSQKTLDGKPYVVEYYDERFQGEEAESIVEIWIPIEPVR